MKKIVKLFVFFVCLAKISEAVPKKYDAQAEG